MRISDWSSDVCSADLRRAQHLVETGALDVQDLAAQGQDSLEAAVPALLGGPAGGIALHQEQFRLGRIALLAVGELAGQAGYVERALAPRPLTRAPRRLARRGRPGPLGRAAGRGRVGPDVLYRGGAE